MKKLLLLIVGAAVFLHFYPQPKLETWFNNKKNDVLDSFNNITDTRVKLSVVKVREELTPFFDRFSSQEITYVNELTSKRKKITSFYKEYCESNKIDYNLQSANQKTVCKVVGKYTNFF